MAGTRLAAERADRPAAAAGRAEQQQQQHVTTRSGLNAGAPPAANARRALGDIGNLVGAMAVRCHVSKDGIINPVKQEVVSTTWGAKQRRTTTVTDGALKIEAKTEAIVEENFTVSVSTNSEAGDVQGNAEREAAIPIPAPAGHPPRLRPLTRSGRAAAQKKVPTLTATLTARSEAIVKCDIEMIEAEEHVHNIDEGDANNQLCVVDYVEDIYSFYRKTEVQSCVAPDYMSRQNDINDKMRAILIDWLIEVHLKFGLMPETLFLTTNLLDRYLSMESVSRKTLQLVGVTAMLLAAKYEEIIAPEVATIVFISDDAYTRQQVLAMEKSMLNALSFNLTVPTPYVFMVRFLKAASSDKQMELLASFFVELCLTEYMAIKYSPSLLAAAGVYTAHCTLQRSPCWTPTLFRHSGYTELQLRDCTQLMVSLHQNAARSKLVVVHKKYSSAKYQSVASLSPARVHFGDGQAQIDHDGTSAIC